MSYPSERSVMSKRGVIIGGGAFAREARCWAANSKSSGDLPKFDYFLDANPDALSGFPELGLNHLGDMETYQPQAEDLFLIAVGDPDVKGRVVERLSSLGAQFATVLHETAVISASAKIGVGVVIGPSAYIATDSTVGSFTCINSLTGIGHDAKIGEYCTISSQVDVTGNVVIGPMTFVGSGARIMPGVKVGRNSKIGAGALVVRSVRPDTTMFSAPARKF